MLAIELTLLTGRYVATSYNDRRASEWPPHPARLFSALAATHFAEDPPAHDERAALEWLEGLAPPQIAASDATEREVVTVFVPVNDNYVVKRFDERLDEVRDLELAVTDSERLLAQGGQVDKARKELEKNLKKEQSALDKARKKLDELIEKEVAAPASISKGGAKEALQVLPEHRIKQPRTFPSVTPADPRVTFIWPDAQAEPTTLQALDRMLARLVRVGHSSSLVSARLRDDPPSPTFVPSDLGERIRLPRSGQLVALETAFARHQETEPRVMPAQFQSYERARAKRVTTTPCSIFSDDWLILRRAGGPVLPITASPGVARSFRRALMSHFGAGPIPEAFSGHRADGSPSDRDHLALVPLSFIGHPHADGSQLGIALVFPREVDRDDRRQVFRALADWEARAMSEVANADLADGEIPCLGLHLGAAGTLLLERVEGAPKLTNLRSETWCEASTTWLTATPIALDRNPGDLRARTPDKLAKALAEARSTIAAACVRIGLPSPSDVEILPAAPWAGAAKTRDFGGFTLGSTPRVLTHARVIFPTPVRGPVLIGAGRYHGLGLMRPEVARG